MVLNGQKMLSKFNKDFIKNYDENNNKGYILEVNVEYPKKKYLICIVIYHFQLREKTMENAISLFVTYMTNKTMLCT